MLKEFAPADLWETFSDLVYNQNYWHRWVPEGVTDKDVAVSVSGHYLFNSQTYKDIIASIDYEKFKSKLTRLIEDLLTHYKTFDYKHPEVIFQIQLKKKLEELRRRDPFIYR